MVSVDPGPRRCPAAQQPPLLEGLLRSCTKHSLKQQFCRVPCCDPSSLAEGGCSANLSPMAGSHASAGKARRKQRSSPKQEARFRRVHTSSQGRAKRMWGGEKPGLPGMPLFTEVQVEPLAAEVRGGPRPRACLWSRNTAALVVTSYSVFAIS